MREVEYTIRLRLAVGDRLTDAEVSSDLGDALRSDPAYRLLQEPSPCRHAGGNSWWLQSARILAGPFPPPPAREYAYAVDTSGDGRTWTRDRAWTGSQWSEEGPEAVAHPVLERYFDEVRRDAGDAKATPASAVRVLVWAGNFTDLADTALCMLQRNPPGWAGDHGA
jgi:hypothetical protein